LDDKFERNRRLQNVHKGLSEIPKKLIDGENAQKV
jgi:hypothetical protein